MYLLDTNVISELRKSKTRKINTRVAAWADSVASTSLFLSAISILELEIGILLVERRDPPQGTTYRRWLNHQVLPAFSGRVLPVDIVVAQCCAKMHVPDPCSDRDAFIAATAFVNDLTVVTRNVSDFKPTGVALINPWKY